MFLLKLPIYDGFNPLDCSYFQMTDRQVVFAGKCKMCRDLSSKKLQAKIDRQIRRKWSDLLKSQI